MSVIIGIWHGKDEELEHITDENGSILKFDDESSANLYLNQHGISDEDIHKLGIIFETID